MDPLRLIRFVDSTCQNPKKSVALDGELFGLDKSQSKMKEGYFNDKLTSLRA
jgi:hypothetical protein